MLEVAKYIPPVGTAYSIYTHIHKVIVFFKKLISRICLIIPISYQLHKYNVGNTLCVMKCMEPMDKNYLLWYEKAQGRE